MEQQNRPMTDELVIPEQNSVGRPEVITEEVVQKLESILQLGVSDGMACQYAKIGRTTFYKKLKEDEEFADRIQSAKDLVTISAGQVVTKAIVKDKDLTTAKWWLERKAPDEFGDKKAELPPVQVNVGVFNNAAMARKYSVK